jgi:tripartite-type tricarboxylate transporter receptor subunit TctC
MQARALVKPAPAHPSAETPQQFAAFIAAELAKWTDLSNSTGIRVD